MELYRMNVMINDDMYREGKSIWVSVKREDGIYVGRFDKKTGYMNFEKHAPNVQSVPTMMFGMDSHEFLQAFANELHRIGIKADAEVPLKNELDAVRYHLEDMRKLTMGNMGFTEEEIKLIDKEKK